MTRRVRVRDGASHRLGVQVPVRAHRYSRMTKQWLMLPAKKKKCQTHRVTI